MKTPQLKLLGLSLVMALSAGCAVAEKPDHAGGGRPDKWERADKGDRGDRGDRGNKHDREDRRERGDRRDRDDGPRYVQGGDRDRSYGGTSINIQIGSYFGDNQRRVANDYYGSQFRSGHCPPGLAKKGNGCQPPGQAKKWRRGYALPPDVVYYPVPNSVSVQLGVPPAGYKYVRVAADILLIAVGTSMVVDAIEDLGRF
jgi:Ni/Co efflux regulator RcnB